MVISTEKSKVMLCNCSGNINCNSIQLEKVDEYRYLGAIIKSNSISPLALLQDRVLKAKKAFNIIKCNARILGLGNCRVRLALINALVISSLLYGSVIFACLGNHRVALEHSNQGL